MYRRDFLQRLTAAAATLGAAAAFRPASLLAEETGPRRLSIASRTLDINGKAARVYGLIQPDGTQGFDAGSSFDVALANEIDAPTLIHWHGLTPPWAMDGVPDNPAAALSPGEGRRYTFPVGTGGTHWMHAHTLQEQNLLAAPLIVRTEADRQCDEQEVVILLHDFSFTPAEELLAKLRGGATPGGMTMDHAATAHGKMQGHAMPGMQMDGMKMGDMKMPHMPMGHMKMAGMGVMDLNDIEYDAYLANDRTLGDPQIVAVEKGGRVRLRIINGATATGFTIDLQGLGGELIAVDGQAVAPIAGKSFPIAMGQRLDIRLQLPKSGGAHPILALREGAVERAGIILASRNAKIGKLAIKGTGKGPVLDLALERKLRAVEPLEKRAPDRRYALALTGDMASYRWGIEGGDALAARQGQRIEIALENHTMMAHPMHLHGHHFQLVAIQGKAVAGAVRDTVLIPPGAAVTIAFDAANPGKWPLHCHHLYHMATGMMAYVAYEGVG